MRPIDLRSDAVSKSAEEMRRAVYRAEVQDEICGNDPTFTHCSRGIEAAVAAAGT